jgi:hypothetical protein
LRLHEKAKEKKAFETFPSSVEAAPIHQEQKYWPLKMQIANYMK